MSVRNRHPYMSSASSYVSFPDSPVVSGRSIWGDTDENLLEISGDAPYSIGEEVVSKKTYGDYRNLMKMNIRLLKSMCLKTLCEGMNLFHDTILSLHFYSANSISYVSHFSLSYFRACEMRKK